MENDAFKWFFTPAEQLPEGVGYGVFTPKHFALVAVSIALSIAIAWLYRRVDYGKRILIRRILAVVLVASEGICLIMYKWRGVDVANYLPLEICSFGVYAIIIDAIWTKERFLLDLMLYIFMPGALMALISPVSAGQPAINYFTLQSYQFHLMIAAYVIARFAAGEIRVRYRDLWTAALKTIVLAAVMYGIDILVDRNIMFLRGSGGNYILGMIERAMGPGPAYLLGLVVFAISVIHIFFVVFKALEALFLSKEKRKS